MHQPKLTSAEIATLWTAYVSESMAIRVLQYFLKQVEDEPIRELLDYALELSEKHIQTITHIFLHEKAHLPLGFSDEDVNLQAPRLYTDLFFLYYTHNLAKVTMNTYSSALAQALQPEVRSFYTDCLAAHAELFNRSTDVMVQKGKSVQAPFIPLPEKVDIVQRKNFLGNWFGDQRPLMAIEIKDVFSNMQRNALGKALLLGFSQVAQNPTVRDYMKRGVEIAAKHVRVFGGILDEEHLPAPAIYDDQVTKSTISPFSDKLLLYHTAYLISSSIGYYGMAMGMSPRRDLALQYTRLIAEIGKYSLDGAKISIDLGWMEQPPTSPDRKALSKA